MRFRLWLFLIYCMVSVLLAVFASGWGPGAWYESYIPYPPDNVSDVIGQAFFMAPLYLPLLYILAVAANRLKSKSTD